MKETATLEERIKRRQDIIEALSDKRSFQLIRFMLDSDKPINVTLDFMLNFPGWYRSQAIATLERLQELGLVSVSEKVAIINNSLVLENTSLEVTYQRGSIFNQPQDEIAVSLINLIFS